MLACLCDVTIDGSDIYPIRFAGRNGENLSCQAGEPDSRDIISLIEEMDQALLRR